jgi:hypothetical protein
MLQSGKIAPKNTKNQSGFGASIGWYFCKNINQLKPYSMISIFVFLGAFFVGLQHLLALSDMKFQDKYNGMWHSI